MQADAAFADATPEDAHGAVRAGRELVGLATAHAFLQELLVVTKAGRVHDGLHLPGAYGDELGLARRDGKGGQQLVARRLDHGDAVRGVHDDGVFAQHGVGLVAGHGFDFLDAKGADVRHHHDIAKLETVDLLVRVQFREEAFVRVEALKEAGAIVVGVAVIVERGAKQAIIDAGYEYRAAFQPADLGL